MLIVGDNLRALVKTLAVCDENLVEEYSIQIHIDDQIRRLRDEPGTQIVYGRPYDPDAVFYPAETAHDGVQMARGDRVLACSDQNYRMPTGYFGLIQTKGSLARLFVSATCNDGQVEPGYAGRITLELANDGRCAVTLPIGAAVAQMFMFRCSTDAKPYAGRYQGATGPTIADFSTRL